MLHQLTFPWIPRRAPRLGRQRNAALVAAAPRMAPAAVRIPDPRILPLPMRFVSFGPQIFIHEGARQGLERRLGTAFNGPVQLAVTDNRRRMVTHTLSKGTLRVRLHMMFLDAPERVSDALVRYIVHGDRQASQIVGEFIDLNSHRIRASRPAPGPLRARGKVHDLQAILHDVNERYFGGAISDVLVTWGRRTRPRSKPRATIKLGSYSAVERLIRIHPCLDAEWVPRYFLSYIVFHELLHHVQPGERSGGRTLLHSPEFRRRERMFRHYERAIAWEQKHIGRLLRSS